MPKNVLARIVAAIFAGPFTCGLAKNACAPASIGMLNGTCVRRSATGGDDVLIQKKIAASLARDDVLSGIDQNTFVIEDASDVIYEDVPDVSEVDIAKVMDWIKAEVTMVKNPFCWRDTYNRGTGTVPGRVADCPATYTNNGATCGRGSHDISAPSKLADCPSGYVNHGLTCHRPLSTYGKGCTTIFKKFHCRSGYTDMGCHCHRDAHNIGPDSMVCPSGYFKSDITARCHKTCPQGYTNTGETCHRPVSTLGMSDMLCRSDEERKGARCYPKGGNCWAHEEYDAGLCYPKCSTHFSGVAHLCWSVCDNSQVNCGAACAKTSADCGFAVADQVIAPLIVAANIASFGLATPATAGVQAGAKTIQIGGKTVAGTSKAGKALVKVVDLLQTVKPNGVQKGASIVQRNRHARSGQVYEEVILTAEIGEVEYTAAQNFRKAYAEDFEELTSTEINAEIDKHFVRETANYLKEVWGAMQLAEMAEANGWQIAESVLAAASIADISGITGLVAAYAKPICKAIVPFPCLSSADVNGC